MRGAWKITSPPEKDEAATFTADFADPVDGEAYWDVYAKWDGCIELRRYFNRSKQERAEHPEYASEDVDLTDGMHICGVDELIQRLQELKDLVAKDYPHWEWPNTRWVKEKLP